MKFTKRAVERLESKSSDYFVWDSSLEGFGVRIYPTGKRVFVFQYRIDGHTRRYKIGPFGSWTTELARKKAQALRHAVNEGTDPSADRQILSANITVSELCDIYLDEGCSHKKASTIATDGGRIERHIRPLIGRYRVRTFTKRATERFMQDIIDGKTAGNIKTKSRGVARVRGGAGAAARTTGLLGGIFAFAVNRELRVDNPVHGVVRPKDQRRERFLSNAEFQRLGLVLNSPDKLNINPTAISAIQLLLLTGCRKSEILKLKWSEVDREGGMLFLSDTKSGARRVFLSDAALNVIARQKQISCNAYVFPASTRVGHFTALWKAWDRIRTAADIKDVHIHDLRHTFASVLAANGKSLFVIGQLLGHKDTRTTQIYAHLTDELQKEAVQGVGEILAKSLSGFNSPQRV